MQIENGGEFGIDFTNRGNEDDIEPWRLFPFPDSSDMKRIKRTMGHLVQENASIREIEDFPENSIAITNNSSADYLLLCTADDVNLAEEIYL
ncbi:hypothetical protein [Acinetobacter pragensis]|uniref:Uncharacterized protein n=1 Tax=Acinetobacter pragensis TaxID=1806892 RepID=A0A151XYU2_9GAMM|nr:hypothetical protein [Acinetobacter pragensis]KYQ70769.1 hypothetical protein AZH43_03355 [Acinetobacter pragensis]